MALRVPPATVFSSRYYDFWHKLGLFKLVVVLNFILLVVLTLKRPFGGRLRAKWQYEDGMVEFYDQDFQWPTVAITGATSFHLCFLSLHRYNKALLYKATLSFEGLFIGGHLVAALVLLSAAFVSVYRMHGLAVFRVILYTALFIPVLPIVIGADACEFKRPAKMAVYGITAFYFAYLALRINFGSQYLFLEEGMCFEMVECSAMRAAASSALVNIAIFLTKAVFHTCLGHPFAFLKPTYRYGEGHHTYDDLNDHIVAKTLSTGVKVIAHGFDHVLHPAYKGRGGAVEAGAVIVPKEPDVDSCDLVAARAATPRSDTPVTPALTGPEDSCRLDTAAKDGQQPKLPSRVLVVPDGEAETTAPLQESVVGTAFSTSTSSPPQLATAPTAQAAACSKWAATIELFRSWRGSAMLLSRCEELEKELRATQDALAHAQEELRSLVVKREPPETTPVSSEASQTSASLRVRTPVALEPELDLVKDWILEHTLVAIGEASVN